MDKSNLLKALDENGLFAEYDDLYRDDVDVRDWVSRHEDLVRSNRAIAQAVQVDAPHDVKEGYFKDKKTNYYETVCNNDFTGTSFTKSCKHKFA